MTAINFPSSPTNGQTFTVGNKTYIYNETKNIWEIDSITLSVDGLENVTNDAQVKKIESSTDGNIPTWNGTTGDELNDGYGVETTLTGSSSNIPRADAVKNYVDGLTAANDAMVFKGTLGSGGTYTSLPTTHDIGWTIKVITAGTYAGQVAEIGDMYVSIVARSGSENANEDWAVIQTNIDGAVVGPASSTDNHVALFDGATGKVIKSSEIKTINSESILGSGNITLSTNLDGLSDVTITSPTTGQVLKYNGTIWVNDTDAGGISLTDLSVSVGSASGSGNLSYNNTNGVFSFTPADLSGKQDTLVSGTSIKTVNNESILGSGNITISGGATIATKSDDVEYKLIFTDETSSAQQNAYINADKLFFNASTGQLNATILNSLSDEKQKTNITPITSATTTIMQLNGVEFEWKDNGNKSAGVIAQQLEEILPHLVYTSSDGLKSVNYSGITGYLIEAIKEQQKQIDELKKSLNK